MSNGDIYPDTGKTFSQELAERSALQMWMALVNEKEKREAAEARLAEAERLLLTFNSQGHTHKWQRATADWLRPTVSASVQESESNE